MSTTLLSAFYDIDFLCKVRGGSKDRGRRASRKSLEFSDLNFCSLLLGDPLPILTFWGREKSRSLQLCSCLVGGEKEPGREEGRAGGSGCSCLVYPEPTAATLLGASRTEFAPPRPAAHGLRITCRNPARPEMVVRLLLR